MSTQYRKRQRTDSYEAPGADDMQVVPVYSGSNRDNRQVVPRNNRYNRPSNVQSSGHSRRRRSFYKRFQNNSYSDPVYPRPEVKFSDVVIGTPAVPFPIRNDNANITPIIINQIAVNDNGNGRIGQVVATKSVYYQFTLNLNADTPTSAVIRHVLFWDRQPNLTAPTLDYLFQNASVGSVGTIVTSPLTIFNRDRFVVLSDDRVTLNINGDSIKFIGGFRTINQKSVYGNGNTLPLTGALWCVFASDQPLATAPSVYGIWRMRYMDM